MSIDAIVKAQEGQQGVPLGMTEMATALNTRHLKFNPTEPNWFDRDRVVLSNGHGSMLLRALLHLTGYPIEEIQRFRELGSHCEVHPERNPAIGIEVTTSPLGQGIANPVEAAYRQSVLGDAAQGVRASIEATVRQGWDAYLGIDGGFVDMTGLLPVPRPMLSTSCSTSHSKPWRPMRGV